MTTKKKPGPPKGSKGGPGRNPIDPGKRRVRAEGRVKPETFVHLQLDAMQHGDNLGRAMDRLVEQIKAR